MPNETIERVIDETFKQLDDSRRRLTRDVRKVMNKLPPEEISILKVTNSESWTRDSNFEDGRIYHTDISPPSNAEIIYIEPISASGYGTIAPFYIIYERWANLASADADSANIFTNSSSSKYYYYFNDSRLQLDGGETSRGRYVEWYLTIGRTSGGEIAAGLTLDAIEYDTSNTWRRNNPSPTPRTPLRGIRVWYLKPSRGALTGASSSGTSSSGGSNGNSGGGDITAVTTSVLSGLSGGDVSGDISLQLDVNRLTAITDLDGTDEFPIKDDSDANDATRKVTLEDIANKLAGDNLTASNGVLSSSGSGGGGLSTVSSDSTLTGEGTSSSPLAVANPFTDAQETKLTGIEPNATADQTGAEIVALLEALSGTDRLDEDALEGGLSNARLLTDADDLDDAVPGFYRWGTPPPTNANGAFGALMAFKRAGESGIDIQIEFRAPSGVPEMRIRSYDGGTGAWSSWSPNAVSQIVSQADAEAGTSTSEYNWTPLRIAQAIAALAPSGGGAGEATSSIYVATFADVADITPTATSSAGAWSNPVRGITEGLNTGSFTTEIDTSGANRKFIVENDGDYLIQSSIVFNVDSGGNLHRSFLRARIRRDRAGAIDTLGFESSSGYARNQYDTPSEYLAASTMGVVSLNQNDKIWVEVLFFGQNTAIEGMLVGPSSGIQIIRQDVAGEDGADGDAVEIQYSTNNTDWHDTLSDDDKYIRFRVGDSGTWTDGAKFVGENTTGAFSEDSEGDIPSAWTAYTWYATSYTPDENADYLLIEAKTNNWTYPVQWIKVEDFRSLSSDTAGNAINTSDNPLGFSLAGIYTQYTGFIGRTSANEVLIGLSDTEGGFTSLNLRTYKGGSGSSSSGGEDNPVAATQDEAEGGVLASLRSWSPLRVKQAIQALARPLIATWARTSAPSGTIPDTLIPSSIARDSEVSTAVSNRMQRSDIVAGTNITLTNGSGNSVTIASTAGGGGVSLPATASQTEAEAGTVSALRSFSPLRIKQAIVALAQPLIATWARASGASGTIPDARIPASIARDSEVTTAVSNRMQRSDIVAGSNITLANGAGNSVTIAASGGDITAVNTSSTSGLSGGSSSGEVNLQLNIDRLLSVSPLQGRDKIVFADASAASITRKTTFIAVAELLAGTNLTANNGVLNVNERYSTNTAVTVPGSWVAYQWYGTGYTPSTSAEYVHLEGKTANQTYPVFTLSIDNFEALGAKTIGDTIVEADDPIVIPLASFNSHYNAYVGRTSSNEVLIAISDSSAGFSSLKLRVS